MAFDKDAFLTALDSMTVMELNDLVKAIEEKFGVSAAASSRGSHGCSGHAELLFNGLHQVIEFHHGHAVQSRQKCVFIECHLDFLNFE